MKGKHAPINRLEVKSRAKIITFRNLLKLLLSLGALQLLKYALGTAIGMAQASLFGDAFVVQLLGVPISIPGEIASIIAIFITAPFELGVMSYLLMLVRGQPVKAAAIFEWAGDSRRLTRSLQYGVWQTIFSAVTFPLGTLSIYYISDKTTAYLNALTDEVLLAGAAPPPFPMDIGFVLALLGIVAYMLLTIPMAALPFVLADNPETRFMLCFKYAFAVMRHYWLSFIVFALSFAVWLFASVVFIVVIAFFLIYFQVAVAVFIEKARQNYNRETFIEGVRAGQNAEEKEDSK